MTALVRAHDHRSSTRSAVAALVALALVATTTTGCVAKKSTNRPGLTISGPGPEIVAGGIMVAGGIWLIHDDDRKDTQGPINLTGLETVIGLGVALVGAVMIGHGIFRLTRPAPAPAPMGPPMGGPGAQTREPLDTSRLWFPGR
ncbi:MAG: hypothetical protein K8W52_11100 [Deltaproteobacteria bacterium]|nr:hypothetical protein [Deltaproteobacteria bacterium]